MIRHKYDLFTQIITPNLGLCETKKYLKLGTYFIQLFKNKRTGTQRSLKISHTMRKNKINSNQIKKSLILFQSNLNSIIKIGLKFFD